ncbi:MAG TPA: hypothetical protein VFI25_15930 [Planctomycetota bacterium]|jgi:hypothetical protein|nr:hypothetical protein [Planctomycetota bacterium]
MSEPLTPLVDPLAAPARRTRLALASLALTLAGPVLYLLLLGDPVLRSTGAPAFLLMAAGIALGLVASRRDPRPRIRAFLAASSGLTALFAFGFFVLAALPRAASAETLEHAPEFTLPDQEGRPVSLGAARSSGPVLLVFFRGHW